MFDLKLQCGPFAVREALLRVRQALCPLDLSTEELDTIELVLAEALNNVVEHAYPETDSAGPITIRCNLAEDGLHFQLRDAGRAMPDEQAPMGVAARVDVDVPDLPEGGFGWFLIRDLAKDVAYHRAGDENILDLRIAIAMHA